MSGVAVLDEMPTGTTAAYPDREAATAPVRDTIEVDPPGVEIDIDEVLQTFQQHAGRLKQEFSRCSKDNHGLSARRARLKRLSQTLRRRRNEWRQEQSAQMAEMQRQRDQLAAETARLALAESRLQDAQRVLGEQFAQLVAERQGFSAEQAAARMECGQTDGSPDLSVLEPQAVGTERDACSEESDAALAVDEQCEIVLPVEQDSDGERCDERANVAWRKQSADTRLLRKIANKAARRAVAVSVRKRLVRSLGWQGPATLAAFVAAGVLFRIGDTPSARWSHLALAAFATGVIAALASLRSVVRAFSGSR